MKHIFLLGIILIASQGFATDSSGTVRGESSTVETVQKQLVINKEPRFAKPISIWAKDAHLAEVLKVMSDRSGMNFVAGEGVHREKVTIILDNTPLDEAINLLVRAAGLSYEIIGNSVLIAEAGKLKEEVGQSSYVIDLKYARAEEVARILSDLTDNVKVDHGGNRLICYTSPRVINEIEDIIARVDHPHVLVMLETRIVEVQMSDLERFGINWSEMNPYSVSISHPASKIVDIAQNNVSISNVWLNVAVDMLVENGDGKILMDSKLTTTNNREASLHIGEIIPYTIQTYSPGVTGGANQEIEKEEVGVILSMLPHINEKGQITLSLEPEVSTIAGWKGPNSDVPLIRTRKTKTTVRVEDGQTIFLAGLLSQEKTIVEHRFPVLSYIPLLGLLFRHKREDVKNTNLIIEVTPRIIDSPEDFASLPSSKKIIKETVEFNPLLPERNLLSDSTSDADKELRRRREYIGSIGSEE